MAIAKDFFTAAFPAPCQILGVELRPFSLGHYLKLSRLGCAFVSEQKGFATNADLILGIVVCSMPTAVSQDADKFWQWLSRRKSGWRYWCYTIKQKLLRKPVATPAEFDCYLWGKQVGDFDLEAKAKIFAEYMDACSVAPAYVEERSDSPPKMSGAPWAQSVLSTLVSKCGYSMEEALNVPVSRALADFIKQAESDGLVTILPAEVFA